MLVSTHSPTPAAQPFSWGPVENTVVGPKVCSLLGDRASSGLGFRFCTWWGWGLPGLTGFEIRMGLRASSSKTQPSSF